MLIPCAALSASSLVTSPSLRHFALISLPPTRSFSQLAANEEKMRRSICCSTFAKHSRGEHTVAQSASNSFTAAVIRRRYEDNKSWIFFRELLFFCHLCGYLPCCVPESVGLSHVTLSLEIKAAESHLGLLQQVGGCGANSDTQAAFIP